MKYFTNLHVSRVFLLLNVLIHFYHRETQIYILLENDIYLQSDSDLTVESWLAVYCIVCVNIL